MFSATSGTGGAELPLDDNYSVLRRNFWLATDRAFKGGVEAITRKRAALKNMTQPEALPDFWKAKPVQKILPVKRQSLSRSMPGPRVFADCQRLRFIPGGPFFRRQFRCVRRDVLPCQF